MLVSHYLFYLAPYQGQGLCLVQSSFPVERRKSGTKIVRQLHCTTPPVRATELLTCFRVPPTRSFSPAARHLARASKPSSASRRSAGEEDSVTGTPKHVKSSVARSSDLVLRWSGGYGAEGYFLRPGFDSPVATQFLQFLNLPVSSLVPETNWNPDTLVAEDGLEARVGHRALGRRIVQQEP